MPANCWPNGRDEDFEGFQRFRKLGSTDSTVPMNTLSASATSWQADNVNKHWQAGSGTGIKSTNTDSRRRMASSYIFREDRSLTVAARIGVERIPHRSEEHTAEV